MTYSYYPGCTLKDRAKQMDIYARASAKALGIELRELADWQCCGAVYPQASDEIASRRAPSPRPRQHICSGLNTSSNFSAVRKPSDTHASFSEIFSLYAFLAVLAALS